MAYNDDDADGKLERMRFPEVTRLPEPLIVGGVTAFLAAQTFGFASGATHPEQLWPGLIAGAAALAGMIVLSRRPWRFERNRRLAGFIMVLSICVTVWAAALVLTAPVLFRVAFGAAAADGVRFVSADRSPGMTGPSLLVMKTDRSSLDALLAAAGPFTPPSEVDRLPAHLSALLPPDLRTGQFRRMLGPARIFADQLPARDDVVVLERAVPGGWETFGEPRLVRVLWDPLTSLAHVVITYPDAADDDE